MPLKHWELVIKTYLKIKSIRKTAIEIGLSKTGVDYILNQMHIQKYSRNRFGGENSTRKALKGKSLKIRDKKIMRKLYIKDKLSTTEIARKFKTSPSTINRCLIQCGIKMRTPSQALKGKPCPNNRGSKHKDWKGGITHWRKRTRKLLNPVFVRPVMERDGFKCVLCGRKRKLVVHHLFPFWKIVKRVKRRRSFKNEEEFINQIVAEHKLAYGITHCKLCHDEYHKKYGKGAA